MFTVDSAKSVLGYLLTADSPSPRPGSWQVELHTDDPGPYGRDNGVMNVDTAYMPQSVEFEWITDTVEGVQVEVLANKADVTFPAAAAAYPVAYVSIQGDGQAVTYSRLTTPFSVASGSVVAFPRGELRIRGEI